MFKFSFFLIGELFHINKNVHVCYSTDGYTCTALLTIFFLSSSSNLSLFAASSNAFGLEHTLFGENNYFIYYMYML